jgi:hypothetical protein
MGHYTNDSVIYLQQFGMSLSDGMPTMSGSANISSGVSCGLFGPSTVDPNAGLIFTEHCHGIWRGAFAPFRNGTGNANGFPAEVLETQPRVFVIEGEMIAGKLVVKKDYTCFGYCDMTNWTVPWNCSTPGLSNNEMPGFGTRYPAEDISAEIMAMAKWTAELAVPRQSGENCSTAAAGTGHYSSDSEIYLQYHGMSMSDGMPTMTGAMISPGVSCGIFGPSTVHPNAGLISVEHCNGIWRGAFAPFLNGTGNTNGFDPMILETEPRVFIIEGAMVDGKLVVKKDYTCFGFCDTANWTYPWTCGPIGVPLPENDQNCPTTTTKATTTMTTSTTTTMAPSNVTAAPPTATVSTELTIAAVNYTKLMENSTAVDELKMGIKTTFANKLGFFYTTDHFNVTLSSGSVKAKVDITPPAGKDASAVVNEVNAQKTQLDSGVTDVTLALPTISSLTTDGMSVANITTSTTSDAVEVPVPTPTTGTETSSASGDSFSMAMLVASAAAMLLLPQF